jgi:hypothetical protein
MQKRSLVRLAVVMAVAVGLWLGGRMLWGMVLAMHGR